MIDLARAPRGPREHQLQLPAIPPPRGQQRIGGQEDSADRMTGERRVVTAQSARHALPRRGRRRQQEEVDVTPALGAALANQDDPILLPPDAWAMVLQMAATTGLGRPFEITDAAVEAAVTAERERIAQVAEDLGAHYHDDGHSVPFATYLRSQSATKTQQQGAQT